MVDANSPHVTPAETRLTILVWASTMGTYLLLAIGGVTTLLDGGTACSAWPRCAPGVIGNLSDPAVIVAIGHRIAALMVGLLLAVTAILAWRYRKGRVSAILSLAVLLYPVQVGVGALAVTRDTAALSDVHLVLGVGIFALTILALLVHLESANTNPAVTSDSATETTSREPSSAPVDELSDHDQSTKSTGMFSLLRTQVSAYVELMKPRLMWLLCLVAVAAMTLAAGPDLTMKTALTTVTGGVLAVGASGTFNNVLERDVDQEMGRTADRPLAQGRIPVSRAVTFGFLLTGLSVGVFVVFVNVLSALLALLAIVFYSIVYTLVLKPHTRQNIVLGGVVGAFPALIGWAAVENTVGMPALLLGGVIFLWTPAHFYNLALAYKDDYARAGFPMLPVVRGEETTRRHILLYLGATLLSSVVLGITTRLDWLYAMTIVLVGSVFLWTVLRLFREQTEQAAFRTFHASNAYLGCLLLAIFTDALLV